MISNEIPYAPDPRIEGGLLLSAINTCEPSCADGSHHGALELRLPQRRLLSEHRARHPRRQRRMTALLGFVAAKEGGATG